MKATMLLRRDHEDVRKLLRQLARARTFEHRSDLLDRIVTELEVHAKVEEELFYPIVEPLAPKAVAASEHDHAEITRLVAEVQGLPPDSAKLPDALAKLETRVRHHAAREERDLFRTAARLGHEHLAWLGGDMAARKHQLLESPLQSALRGMKKIVRRVA